MALLDPRRIADFIEPFRVEPGRRVRLPHDFDPTGTRRASKSDTKEILGEGIELLAEYQARLAAQDTYGLLVVFQAMDAAGKDGTISHVMSGVNPQGVQVSSFKVPSTEDLDHDYLWRYARRLPERGNIGIFNRSYYEEVLVVRVHPQILAGQKLPPKAKGAGVWERRFREINDWERYLVDNGIRIVKVFLNVSKEEQRRRFLARIDMPEKNWKFSANDVKERAYWDDYQRAFADVLSNTSTAWAPWYVIPADDKPFARVAAAGVIANALIEIDPHFPKVEREAAEALHLAKVTLEAEAPKGAAPDPIEAEAIAHRDGKKAARAAIKAERRALEKAAKAAKAAAKAGRKAARTEGVEPPPAVTPASSGGEAVARPAAGAPPAAKAPAAGARPAAAKRPVAPGRAVERSASASAAPAVPAAGKRPVPSAPAVEDRPAATSAAPAAPAAPAAGKRAVASAPAAGKRPAVGRSSRGQA